jgi:uncharacterized membrane protein YeaQ/YmgE (transglycosylase-associated protein family)
LRRLLAAMATLMSAKEVAMNIIAWIVVGLIAGAIAKMLMPGDDPGGIVLTILLGIAGAIVGGFVAIALNISNGVDDFDIGTIVLAVLGSMLLLFGYRMVAGESRRL